MSVKFRVVSRRNQQHITATENFYATAIAQGKVNLKRLATLSQQKGGITLSP